VELLHIPKGTKLFLSVVGCNRSKEVWGEGAGVWRPERWLSAADGVTESNRGDGGEKKGKGTTKKPYSDRVKIPGAWNGMLTFLGGGRSCVGSRFAIMEMSAWFFFFSFFPSFPLSSCPSFPLLLSLF
jgi:cytochrome P450